MPRYHYRVSYHNQTRSVRRTKRLIYTFSSLIVVGVLVVAVDVIRNIRNNAKPTSQTTNSAVQAATVNYFRTEFFQFQTNPDWREIANESRTGHYVYRSYSGPLVEQELIIDVNRVSDPALANVQTQRVFPARIMGGGRLEPDSTVSDHCAKAVKPGMSRVPQVLTYQQVTFACNPDSATYMVAVGIIGATEDIVASRPNGEKATYNITYRNLMANPHVRDLTDIVQTFETR